MATEALQEEIDRIVRSPWPTQLKHLHELAKTADIPLWASQHPYQISHLAKLIVDARFTWPYIYDLVAILSIHPALRDAFLQHAPQLLHELLTREKDDCIITTLVTLLSSPLPSGVLLPAEIQHFFLHVVDCAERSPCLNSIKTLHTILNGACGSFVGLLSAKNIEDVGRKLCAIVNSFSTAEGDCSILYALSCILALLTSLQNPQSYPRLSAYFSSSKAVKTLHLIVLKVVWATRADTDDIVAQQTFELAELLLPGLSTNTREEWCRHNAPIVHKLEEKIELTTNLDRRVRAIHFLASITTPTASVLATLRPIVANTQGLLLLYRSSTPDQLAHLLPTLSPSAMSALLSTLVNSLDESHTAPSLEGLNGVLVVCNQVLAASKLDHGGIIAAMSSTCLDTIRRQAEQLSTVHVRQDQRVHFSQLRLAQQICQVFLHVATADDDRKLLINAVGTLSTALTAILTESLMLQKSSGLKQVLKTTATSWQTSIEAHIRSKLQTEQAGLEHIFRLHCSDLEQRCANIEQPLREEQALTASLRQQIAELEAVEIQQQQVAANLERRLEKSRKSNAAATAQHEELARNNEAMRSQLAHAKQEHDRVLITHQEEVRSLTSEHSAARLQASMQQVQHQAQIEDLSKQMSVVQQAVTTCKQEYAEQQSYIHRLTSEGESTRLELSSARAEQEDTVMKLRQAQQRLADLVNQAHMLEDQLAVQTTTYAADIAQSKLDAATHIEQQRQELAASFNEQVKKLDEDHRLQTGQLSTELHTLQGIHHELEEKHKSIRKQAQDQAHKLELLRHACQDKDAEITKLRGIRDNMMAAMGLPPIQVDDESTIADMPTPSALKTQTSFAAVSTRRPAGNQQPRHLRRATSDNVPIPTPRSPLGSLSANTSPAKRAHRRATVHKILEEGIDLHAFDEDDLMTSTS